MDTFTIKSRMSKKNYVRVALKWSWKIVAINLIAYTLLAIYFFYSAFIDKDLKSVFFYIDIISGLLLLVGGPLLLLYRIQQKYKKHSFLNNEMIFKFEPDKISIYYWNGKERTALWTEISKILMVDRYYLLFLKEGVYYIDGSQLSDGQSKYIFSKIPGPKIKSN
jgi:hypothetical protein